MEYVFAQPGRFEFYGGGTVGLGGVNIHLEKSAAPQSWDGFWGSYKTQPDTTENISSDLNHSFFMDSTQVRSTLLPD
ncbi:MAG: hypothetical protein NTW14_05865 [bacterium]|nr:hypothetical protein [bacterium]